MLSFVSDGNVINSLFIYNESQTQRYHNLLHQTETQFDVTISTTQLTSFSLRITNNQNSTYSYKSNVTASLIIGTDTTISRYTSLFSTFQQEGEISRFTRQTYQTAVPTFNEVTGGNPGATSPHLVIEDVTDTERQTTYGETIGTGSFTYPALFSGNFYYSKPTNVFTNDSFVPSHTFVTSNGITSTYGGLSTYQLTTYSTALSTGTITTKGEVSYVRTKSEDYARGDLGVYYTRETSNNEMLIVVTPTVLNTQVSFNNITNFPYVTANNTTLLYKLLTDFDVTAATKISSTSYVSNGADPGVFIGGDYVSLGSPPIYTVVSVDSSLYTRRATNFITPATLTYFSGVSNLPFTQVTSGYFSATQAGATGATTANPVHRFYVGGNPDIHSRQVFITTKSTNIPGLGNFPFSLDLTASRNGIQEVVEWKTVYDVLDRSVSTTSAFSHVTNGNNISPFYPDFVTEQTNSTSLVNTDHVDWFTVRSATTTVGFTHDMTSQVGPGLRIRTFGTSNGPTLYSNFIMPGISIFGDTNSKLYQNATVLGGPDIYELFKASDYPSVFDEVLVLHTFTNLRSFLADDYKINYMQWISSDSVKITVLDNGGILETTYTIAYGPEITKSCLYTTRQLNNNGLTWFNTTYGFGGPNLYSKPEMVLAVKGKYEITRYNVTANTSLSSSTNLELFDVITCATSEVVKFVVYPYITLDTAIAPLKNYLDSTVLVAIDIEE